MIKKIIFDIDNTLISWNNKWWNTVEETFNIFGIECDDHLQNKFIEAISLYQNATERFSELGMRDFVSKMLEINLPEGFIIEWKTKLACCIPEIDLDLIECIKYLASKYELCVATNWFTDQQSERLKKIHIYEYFKEVVGCDMFNMKPDLEMYKYLIGDYSSEEVVVVGDSFTNDIEPALELNIYAYYITEEIKKTKNNLYAHIKSVKDLRQIL